MSLRNRLFLVVAGVVAMAVALVTWIVSASAGRVFRAIDDQRTATLVSQWRREFTREGEEVERRVERVAASEAVRAIALDLGSPSPDPAAHVNDAASLATAHGLDFLDLVAEDGTIVSSAHWPARFGYRRAPLAEGRPADRDRAFLHNEEVPEGHALGLLAVRAAGAGDLGLRVVGGRRLDQAFLSSLGLPAGMRVLLYRNLEPGFAPQELLDSSGAAGDAAPFEPLVSHVRILGHEVNDTIDSKDGPQTVQAVPLVGREGTALGILFVVSSRSELVGLLAAIRRTGLAVGGFGIALGFILSYVLAARITRRIERLADAARSVAAGHWDVRVEEGGSGETGALSTAFNTMTGQLLDQRDRLVQAERVAAWRELARRLAHELKNPLFPLRITVENLQRAKHLPPAEFAEVLDESTSTLSAGLTSLTGVVGQFSDFAKMPTPEFQPVDLNDLVRGTMRLIDAQLAAPGRPPVAGTMDLDPGAGTIQADPNQLGRALQNLLLNAIDAMPDGGRLAVRTERTAQGVRLSVADSGKGMTEEERTRLFTPYYTTKQHGTGLGLAIVQSVVADHRGKIRVESPPGAGATFYIELPDEPREAAGNALPFPPGSSSQPGGGAA